MFRRRRRDQRGAISYGANVFVAKIMQHIEEAGIHSGDTACSMPPHSLDAATLAELGHETEALVLALGAWRLAWSAS